MVTAPGCLEVRRYPTPEVGPRDALLTIEMVGVCGSDPKYFRGSIAAPMPLVLGHEMVGRIERIGDEAAAAYQVRAGDRVIVEACVPCGLCPACLTGSYRFCRRARTYGTRMSADVPPHLWGGYADAMFLLPGSIVHRISDRLPAESAVLINAVIANGIQWVVLMGGARLGSSVVVQGAGPQGFAAAVAAREAGARRVVVTGLARDAHKESLLLQFGADAFVDMEGADPLSQVRAHVGADGPDLVVDVTGNPQAIATSVGLVRPQGTVIVAGLTGGRSVPLPTDEIALREVRLQGVFSKGNAAVAAAVALVESNRYPFERMVTHRYPLEDAEQALRVAAGEVENEPAVKVVLTP